MNELTQRFGLEYGVKFYINRSDIYVDFIFDLSFSSNLQWFYTNDSKVMTIIFIRDNRRRYE